MTELVLARGTAGWRAASVLAARGATVRWLVPGDEPADDPCGVFEIRPDERALMASALGPLVDIEPERTIAVRGRREPLPLRPTAVADALGAAQVPGAAVGLVGARLSRRVGNVFDLGGEERSYAEFVRNRLGRPIEETLFSPYAEKRFATTTDAIAGWVAWRVHFRDEQTVRVAPRDGLAAARAWAIARVRAAGGDVVEGATPVGLEVDGGRITAVVTALGREHVSRVWSDLSPVEVADLLPPDAVDETWRFDLGRLRVVNRIEVALPADTSGLPFETHVIDRELPFHRMLVPERLPGNAAYAGRVIFEISVASDDPRWAWSDATWIEEVRRAAAGLCAPASDGGGVTRRPGATPVLTPTTPQSLARRLDAFDALGWVGIGPGSGRDLDFAEEIELVADVLAAGAGDKRAVQQRETHRRRFERPVRLPARVSPRAWSTG